MQTKPTPGSTATSDPSLNGTGPDDPVLAVVTARALCEQPEPSQEAEVLGQLLVRRQRTTVGGATGAGNTSGQTQQARVILACVPGRLKFVRGLGGATSIDTEVGPITITG
jgi:hypothetical protein